MPDPKNDDIDYLIWAFWWEILRPGAAHKQIIIFVKKGMGTKI